MENTVDRESRDSLVAAINRYLEGETTAFQFDDEIFSIESDDPTVTHVVCELWYFYDDCKNHRVNLAKEAWDYYQRLILVLQSNAHVEVSTQRRWDGTQLIALAALLLFLYTATWLGFGIQLFALAIPFGAVSIAISYWRNRASPRKMDGNQLALTPFSSFNELIHLRRRLSSFRKRKYPAGMKRVGIRTPIEETAVWLQVYAARLFLSPLVLAFQSLPMKETDTRVAML